MPSYAADDLFLIREVGPSLGMPTWANLRIGFKRQGAVQATELAGPGLYGVIFDGFLIYVGLYAGDTDPSGGCVLDRWYKHILGMTLRGRDIFFSPTALKKILRIPGDPAEDLAQTLLNGRDTTIPPRLKQKDAVDLYPPLRTRTVMSNFNKAMFASRHWETLRTGNESQILGHFTFEYQRITSPNNQWPDKDVVKSVWLLPRETNLIKQLRPICNKETDPASARDNVTPKEVREEMVRLLADLVGSFCSASQPAVTPHTSRDAPVRDPNSRTGVERNDARISDDEMSDDEMSGDEMSGDEMGDDEMSDDEMSDDEMSGGEARFRQVLSTDGERFVGQILEKCPDGFNPFFTEQVAQLRISLNIGAQRRLLAMTPSRGGFQCHTLASVEACRAIGLDAKPVRQSEAVMHASFWLDPAKHDPATVFAVLGAATHSLTG